MNAWSVGRGLWSVMIVAMADAEHRCWSEEEYCGGTYQLSLPKT
jgi:hypothetical protein